MHSVVSERKRKRVFSRVLLFVTPRTLARQAPLPMKFSRQEYWSGLPCPLPGDLPNSGIKPTSLAPPALADEFFITVPNEGQKNMIQKVMEGFSRNTEFCTWSWLAKIRLNLIKKRNFKGKVVQNLNLIL